MRIVVLTALLLGGLGVAAQRSTAPVNQTLPAGGGSVAIADLDKDGHLDILTVARNQVIVYLGDGRGRFTEAAGSPFVAGENPSDLAFGDFDEDGRLDVVVANHETSYVSWLAGTGTGGLGPPVRIPITSRPHPHGVAAGDFNGDGHLDLAVESWQENTVLIVHGNGTGVFSREPARHAVGPTPYYRLRAGDLNADGNDDVVTTNTDGSSVSVLCTDRTGALQPARTIATAPSPFAVAIGDVNGDGRQDLAVAHRWGGVDPELDGLTVLIGSGNCAFTSSPESPLKVGASPTAVAIGDIDGDGIGDIATANMGSHDVTLFLGGRTGVRPASSSPHAVGRGPMSIALSDVNGDGKADIITGNGMSGSVSVSLEALFIGLVPGVGVEPTRPFRVPGF